MVNRFEAELSFSFIKLLLIMAVMGTPFYLWDWGTPAGYILSVLSGLIIYPAMLGAVYIKLTGRRPNPDRWR